MKKSLLSLMLCALVLTGAGCSLWGSSDEEQTSTKSETSTSAEVEASIESAPETMNTKQEEVSKTFPEETETVVAPKQDVPAKPITVQCVSDKACFEKQAQTCSPGSITLPVLGQTLTANIVDPGTDTCIFRVTMTDLPTKFAELEGLSYDCVATKADLLADPANSIVLGFDDTVCSGEYITRFDEIQKEHDGLLSEVKTHIVENVQTVFTSGDIVSFAVVNGNTFDVTVSGEIKEYQAGDTVMLSDGTSFTIDYLDADSGGNAILYFMYNNK